MESLLDSKNATSNTNYLLLDILKIIFESVDYRIRATKINLVFGKACDFQVWVK